MITFFPLYILIFSILVFFPSSSPLFFQPLSFSSLLHNQNSLHFPHLLHPFNLLFLFHHSQSASGLLHFFHPSSHFLPKHFLSIFSIFVFIYFISMSTFFFWLGPSQVIFSFLAISFFFFNGNTLNFFPSLPVLIFFTENATHPLLVPIFFTQLHAQISSHLNASFFLSSPKTTEPDLSITSQHFASNVVFIFISFYHFSTFFFASVVYL